MQRGADKYIFSCVHRPPRGQLRTGAVRPVRFFNIIPLASRCKTVVAYDPCAEAICLLKRQNDGCKNVVPSEDLSDVTRHGPYDVVVCVFGVLSHIPDPQARRVTLEFLQRCIVPGGWLVMSVPNRRRRFYKQQLRALRQGDFSGRIDYRRNCVGQWMPYYLYTATSLHKELQELGLSVEAIKPESVFPERFVTKFNCVSALEKTLLPHTPSWFGYGLLATARKQ
jgi:tRNA (uracil-5-)-methyltransferase TRM9